MQGELNRLVAGIHEVELKATEGRVRHEELAQEAYRTYGVDAEGLLAQHDPLAISTGRASGSPSWTSGWRRSAR